MSANVVLVDPFLAVNLKPSKKAPPIETSYVMPDGDFHRREAIKVKVINKTGADILFKGSMKLSDGTLHKIETSVPPGTHEVEVLDSPGKFLASHGLKEQKAELKWEAGKVKGEAKPTIKPVEKSSASHGRGLGQIRAGNSRGKRISQKDIDNFIDKKLTPDQKTIYNAASPSQKGKIDKAVKRVLLVTRATDLAKAKYNNAKDAFEKRDIDILMTSMWGEKLFVSLSDSYHGTGQCAGIYSKCQLNLIDAGRAFDKLTNLGSDLSKAEIKLKNETEKLNAEISKL